jgi:hypothetical protein
MRRRAWLPAALAAFLGGIGLAGAGNPDEALTALEEHQKLLRKDLQKIERACADIVELRRMRESGEYILNDEEKGLERQSRQDLHIFMERFRNDTLEVLEILDRAVAKKDIVDPLRRVYGKALDQVVSVSWEEEDLDMLVAELEEDYGVPLNISGEIDLRKTVSLNGQMSLLSVLLQLENVFDGKFVVKEGGHLWLVLVPPRAAPVGEAPKKE